MARKLVVKTTDLFFIAHQCSQPSSQLSTLFSSDVGWTFKFNKNRKIKSNKYVYATAAYKII